LSRPGTQETPLRVAVIGSGPAGFYAVQSLFKLDAVRVRVDMFDRLPTPFGLVRHGVAPDHQKIKSVTAVYDKLARNPAFRFFGNVEYGRDLTLDDLREHYHQIVFCTGAQTDRRLNIPGEDLEGSHPATEFVAWYNGHPDFVNHRFDLSHERAVVVGVGNVAVDVARILCRTTEELRATDVADYALEALAQSRVREVWLVGRRGPAQAAFTNPEVRELGELPGAEAATVAEEMELDALSADQVERDADKNVQRRLELLRAMIERREPDKPRRLRIRFLLSPVELLGDPAGRVRAVKLERNELFLSDAGRLSSRGVGTYETLDAGLVFRSVGYRGVALDRVPFRDDWGVVPNADGRILDPSRGNAAIPGLYVSGWIKRGPSGVIGTNKQCAQETVAAMAKDLEGQRFLRPRHTSEADVPELLHQRGVAFVSYEDWLRLDALEIEAGREAGRPRVKFTSVEDVLGALRV
jgi:ferredoxin--NADP+ reductase